MNFFPQNIMGKLVVLKNVYEKSTRVGVIDINYPIVEIKKQYIDKEISIKLFYDDTTESFEIQAPTYKYFSKISHYDFRVTERRWCRSKEVLFCVIKNLQRCGLWGNISNKDFIIVNSSNERTNPEKLKEILDAIL